MPEYFPQKCKHCDEGRDLCDLFSRSALLNGNVTATFDDSDRCVCRCDCPKCCCDDPSCEDPQRILCRDADGACTWVKRCSRDPFWPHFSRPKGLLCSQLFGDSTDV